MRAKRHAVALAVIFCWLAVCSSIATASVQAFDKLRFGGRTYVIFPSPMKQLWYIGKAEPPRGKIRAPKFRATPNNWGGYFAKWEIRNAQLYLTHVRGRVGGQGLRNEELLPDREFPVEADWFTGRIQIAVGDYSEETNEDTAVITFDIEKGEVKSMTFLPHAKSNLPPNGR